MTNSTTTTGGHVDAWTSKRLAEIMESLDERAEIFGRTSVARIHLPERIVASIEKREPGADLVLGGIEIVLNPALPDWCAALIGARGEILKILDFRTEAAREAARPVGNPVGNAST